MLSMFLRRGIGIFICFCAGIGVASGTFAFLLFISVIPRLIQKAKIDHKIIFVENMVIRGIMFGTVLSLFSWKKRWIYELLGRMVLTIFGVSAGIFTGCISVALAEILDVFPIFFRRINLKQEYCEGLLFVMAIGKLVGSLFYFFFGYDIIVP